MRHQRMGVRASAGLDGCDLARRIQVADVKDADAAEPLGIDVAARARCAAIQPPTVLLHRHEQQIAVHRQVALSARAHHRQHQPGLPARHVIGVETVEVADEQLAVRHRHVAVGQRQQTIARRVGPHPRHERLFLLRRRQGDQRLGVKEPRRRRHGILQHHPGRRLTRVMQAGRQGVPGIGRLGRCGGGRQQNAGGGGGG